MFEEEKNELMEEKEHNKGSYNAYIGGKVISSEDDEEEDNLPVEKAWYVINTFGTKERNVKDDLEKRKISFHMEDKIFRIIVAEYEEPDLDENGKQKMTKDKKTGLKVPKFKVKNYYPGYIFVEMIMTDETWFVVRNTPGVSGITGSSGKGAKPFPIPREEIEPVLKRRHIEDPERYSEYKVGDWVKILNGTFQDSEGEIVDIDTTKGEVRIQITLFGRATFVPASFSDIEKADENDTRDYSL